MANAGAIRAGQAFVEVTIKDGLAHGVRSAQAKLAAFGAAVKAQNTVIGASLAAIVSPITAIAAGLAGLAVGGPLVKAVQSFVGISKAAKDAGIAISGIDPNKATSLTRAWEQFKAVLSAIGFIIGDALATPVTNAIRAMTDLVVTGISLAQNWKLVGQAAGAALTFGFETAKLAIVGTFLDAFDAIRDASGQAVAFMAGSWNEFASQFKSAHEGQINFVVGVWNAIKDAGLSALGVLTDAWKTFFGFFGEHFSQMAELAKKVAMAIGRPLVINPLVEAGLKEAGRGLDFGKILGAGEQARKAAAAGFVGHGPLDTSRRDDAFDLMQGSMSLLQQDRMRALKAMRGRLAGVQDPSVLGSSAGTFAVGGGTSLLGIGAGGGLKVKDEEAIRAINNVKVAVEGINAGVRAK